MIRLNKYDQSIFLEDRIDGFITEFSNFIDTQNPIELSILDPYFDYDKLYQCYEKSFDSISDDLWICLLNEITTFYLITKITILSAEPNKRQPLQVEQLFGKNSAEFVRFNYNKSDFYCYHYKNPKKSNHYPNKPHLHDRWLLWKNSDNTNNAIHIGTSLGDIYNKDVTITTIPQSDVQNYFDRYEELIGFANE